MLSSSSSEMPFLVKSLCPVPNLHQPQRHYQIFGSIQQNSAKELKTNAYLHSKLSPLNNFENNSRPPFNHLAKPKDTTRNAAKIQSQTTPAIVKLPVIQSKPWCKKVETQEDELVPLTARGLGFVSAKFNESEADRLKTPRIKRVKLRKQISNNELEGAENKELEEVNTHTEASKKAKRICKLIDFHFERKCVWKRSISKISET
eukprot:TRINITY_DN4478_c0_g1_i5.p1 TRINITY_DN4478_c0_g1~~TRINITY_DN4478_c0_g1_i5.p1  ORF type:complete len:204 (+),score=18.59 TRINITY_DN4478_c0_g1_i5:347-958(+)